MPLAGLGWRRGSRALSGRTEVVQLTASAYTIAGALVGAGVGEPSPWPFESPGRGCSERGISGHRDDRVGLLGHDRGRRQG